MVRRFVWVMAVIKKELDHLWAIVYNSIVERCGDCVGWPTVRQFMDVTTTVQQKLCDLDLIRGSSSTQRRDDVRGALVDICVMLQHQVDEGLTTLQDGLNQQRRLLELTIDVQTCGEDSSGRLTCTGFRCVTNHLTENEIVCSYLQATTQSPEAKLNTLTHKSDVKCRKALCWLDHYMAPNCNKASVIAESPPTVLKPVTN